jgi:hypothetical protein
MDSGWRDARRPTTPPSIAHLTCAPRGPILPLENVNEILPPDLPGGIAASLRTLRHALADPLSAAGLKLELVERRLEAIPSGGPALVDRVRGAKADLAAAGRLIDLLPRLGRIAGETPSETSLGDLCRLAGLPLDGAPESFPRLPLRRLASVDALRTLGSYLRSQASGQAQPLASATAEDGRVSLRIEAGAARNGPGDPDLGRLLQLSRAGDQAEELFLARAGIEADRGTLHLDEREGELFAVLSWPRPAAFGNERRQS